MPTMAPPTLKATIFWTTERKHFVCCCRTWIPGMLKLISSRAAFYYPDSSPMRAGGLSLHDMGGVPDLSMDNTRSDCSRLQLSLVRPFTCGCTSELNIEGTSSVDIAESTVRDLQFSTKTVLRIHGSICAAEICLSHLQRPSPAKPHLSKARTFLFYRMCFLTIPTR